MSKSCCFAFALAVISLPIILLSLEADAQPTVDETMTCSSFTSDKSEVVKMFTRVISNQQQNIHDKIDNIGADVKRLLASNPTSSNPVERSKRVLVSALECMSLSPIFSRFWFRESLDLLAEGQVNMDCLTACHRRTDRQTHT